MMDETIFDDASDYFFDRMVKARSKKKRAMYELVLKALDHYRQDTGSHGVPLLPYVKDALVIPRRDILAWETRNDSIGLTHSKVEFLDNRAAKYCFPPTGGWYDEL